MSQQRCLAQINVPMQVAIILRRTMTKNRETVVNADKLGQILPISAPHVTCETTAKHSGTSAQSSGRIQASASLIGDTRGGKASQASTIRLNQSAHTKNVSYAAGSFPNNGKNLPSQGSTLRVPKQSQAPSRRPVSSSPADQRTAASRGAVSSTYTPRKTRSAVAAKRVAHQPYPMPPIRSSHGMNPGTKSRSTDQK